MKFNCGRTWDEKKKYLEDWHPHVAWWPGRVGSHDCRWLEWVLRKGRWRPAYYLSCWKWEHRAK